MAEVGQTVWDFADKHRWFRWVITLALLLAIAVLLLMGYRLKPDLGLLARESVASDTGTAGVTSELGDKYFSASITQVGISSAQTISVSKDLAVVEKTGLYVVSLSLYLDYRPPWNSGETAPYFSCYLKRTSQDTTAANVLTDFGFGVSCGRTTVVELKAGDRLRVEAGQASGRDRTISGQMTLAFVG